MENGSVLTENERAMKMAEMVEREHGKWVKGFTPSLLYYKFRCSECGMLLTVVAKQEYLSSLPKYCEECGARMNGERKDDENET